MNRIFVVRVGADTTYSPLRSPVFDKGRFEYMPIWEGEKEGGKWRSPPIDYKHPMLRYCDIPCSNMPDHMLDEFVPKNRSQWPAHNDPEFESMTYGDVCEHSARARNLIDNPKKDWTGVRQGDYLFFLARLERHDGNRFTNKAGFYFVGYFHIEKVYNPIQVQKLLDSSKETKIGMNAHVLRAKAEPNFLWTDKRYKFWVFKGGADSRRFTYALEAEWDWLYSVFRDAHGNHWKKMANQSTLQRIMSYTRTIRCQIDPRDPQQRHRYDLFWDKVQQHLELEE